MGNAVDLEKVKLLVTSQYRAEVDGGREGRTVRGQEAVPRPGREGQGGARRGVPRSCGQNRRCKENNLYKTLLDTIKRI